jgi:hypothetical protein
VHNAGFTVRRGDSSESSQESVQSAPIVVFQATRVEVDGWAPSPTVEALRAKLDAAIMADEWEVVKLIGRRIRDIARDGVIDLHTERAKRKQRR